MGTPLENCNFSSHSIFPMSATLRATIIGKNSSYGAERNTFGWELHLKIAISLAIQYFPCPLRSVPQSFLDLSSISVPLRSALRWCKATKHCKIEIKNVCRSGAEHFWMGTPLEHCNFSSHSLFAISAPLRATIIGSSRLLNFVWMTNFLLNMD